MHRADIAENGAITLHQRLVTVGGGMAITFLSTHATGEDRIENLRHVIQCGQ